MSDLSPDLLVHHPRASRVEPSPPLSAHPHRLSAIPLGDRPGVEGWMGWRWRDRTRCEDLRQVGYSIGSNLMGGSILTEAYAPLSQPDRIDSP